jgi:hypothetical protein
LAGTAWGGTDITPATGAQDLVQLVLNGRDRPGQPGFTTVYLRALRQLEAIWKVHGRRADGTTAGMFYDQFYLPAAQNLTRLLVGRSPMPLATLSQLQQQRRRQQAAANYSSVLVRLYIFQTYPRDSGSTSTTDSNTSSRRAKALDSEGTDAIHYTTDGTAASRRSPLYAGAPLQLEVGSCLRATCYRGALAPSRELILVVGADRLMDAAANCK